MRSHHRLMSGGFVNASPVVSAYVRRILMVCALKLFCWHIIWTLVKSQRLPWIELLRLLQVQAKCLHITACFSRALLPEPKQVSQTQCKENISFFTAIGATIMCTFPSHFMPCLYIFKMYLFKSIFFTQILPKLYPEVVPNTHTHAQSCTSTFVRLFNMHNVLPSSLPKPSQLIPYPKH